MSARFRSARLLIVGTSLRIVAVPGVMALVLAGGGDTDTLAALLFAVAAATDFLDGYLARRWQVTTALGSFLDTTADKLLVSGTLIALVAVERASPWLAALIVARELVVLGLKGAVAVGGDLVQPSVLGKQKAAIQFLAIGLAILRPGDPVAGVFADEWAMLLAGAITVWSGVEYLVHLGGALRAEPPPAPRRTATAVRDVVGGRASPTP